MKKGYFKLFIGKDSEFYGTLIAANHEPILQGKGEKTKDEAFAKIALIQKSVLQDSNFKRSKSKDGKPMFALYHETTLLGWSETYSSEEAREKGIESVKWNGQTTEIKDLTGTEQHSIEIFLNKKPFHVTQPAMTGREILALRDWTPEKYCLFLIEGTDQKEIKADESVKLKDGMKFHAFEKDIKFG